MMNIDKSRAERTKRWKIPDKFINLEFVNFLMNINVVSYGKGIVREIPIEGPSGIVEWANHFQLWDLHGIDTDSILKLFDDKGCAKISKKDNCVRHHHQNIAYLQKEIEARIKE